MDYVTRLYEIAQALDYLAGTEEAGAGLLLRLLGSDISQCAEFFENSEAEAKSPSTPPLP